jgi:hypothetical protein
LNLAVATTIQNFSAQPANACAHKVITPLNAQLDQTLFFRLAK